MILERKDGGEGGGRSWITTTLLATMQLGILLVKPIEELLMVEWRSSIAR
jgi:hypothetical protein